MYDLVVIGSGPAGYTAALEAVKFKLRTAVVERDPDMTGGVCLNEGCIPLKGMLHYSSGGGDYHEIRGDVMQRVAFLRSGLRSRLVSAGVEMIDGEARFVSPNEIEVSGRRITAKNFLIAVGSSPKRFFNNPSVFSPEKIFELDDTPKKALIIGGGVIGCEYASFLNNIGVSVDVVEAMPSILFGEDTEMIRTLTREFRKKKIRLFEEASIEDISTDREVGIKTSGGVTREKYDMIFEATGRRANTGRIGLEDAGVLTDEKGFIRTDNNMATNVAGIYAAGDCIPTPMLAYTASREASAAVEHMAKGTQGNIDYSSVPRLVFSAPQIGSVGKSQEKAAEQNIPVKIYRYFFKAIGKAVVEDRDAGLIKLIEDTSTSTIIGASAVGEELTEIMNELTVIIGAKIPTSILKNCIHVHPSYSEIITEALSFGG